MRSAGATPALFGACLACAATGGLCFTAVPCVAPPSRPAGRLSRVSRPPSARLDATRPSSGKGDGNSSSRSSISGDGRKSNFDRLLSISAGAPGVSSDSTRRQRQKSRRKTRLSSTKETSSRTSTATIDTSPAPWTTSQQFEAEVAARRAGGARFPPASGYGFKDDCSSSSSNSKNNNNNSAGREPSELPPRSSGLQEGVLRLTKIAVEGGSGGSSSSSSRRPRSDSQSSTESTTAGHPSHVAQETTTTPAAERQRLLDMTTPPVELRDAAKTRSVGEGEATVGIKVLDGGEGLGAEAKADSAAVDVWASRGMLAGAAMLYGTNFGCVKLLEETVPMSLAAALRFSVAFVPFLPFLRKIKPEVFKAGAEIGLLNAVGYWAQSESLMTTTASKSAFICSLSVIFVPLMDAVLSARDGKEAKLAKAVKAAEKKSQGGVFANLNGPWFPALLAAAGVACLELIGVEGGPNSGDLWALGQPLCFGVGFWLTERCSQKYPGDTFGIVASQLLTVAVLAIGWCAQAGQMPTSIAGLHETVLPSSGSLAVPLSLLWTGLVTTSLTVFGETFAMKQISAAESTIILSTEPIWGTAFAAVVLGETIGWNTGFGALLIVAACTWSSVGPAIQTKLLSLIAATGAAGTSAGVDVDDLSETVGTVFKELAKENIDL